MPFRSKVLRDELAASKTGRQPIRKQVTRDGQVERAAFQRVVRTKATATIYNDARESDMMNAEEKLDYDSSSSSEEEDENSNDSKNEKYTPKTKGAPQTNNTVSSKKKEETEVTTNVEKSTPKKKGGPISNVVLPNTPRDSNTYTSKKKEVADINKTTSTNKDTSMKKDTSTKQTNMGASSTKKKEVVGEQTTSVSDLLIQQKSTEKERDSWRRTARHMEEQKKTAIVKKTNPQEKP